MKLKRRGTSIGPQAREERYRLPSLDGEGASNPVSYTHLTLPTTFVIV
jgi:hypothetical protein